MSYKGNGTDIPALFVPGKNHVRCFFQKEVVIDADPGLWRVRAAKIRCRFHFVKAAAGSKLVKVSICDIAAIPIGRVIAKFLQLSWQGRRKFVRPEAFFSLSSRPASKMPLMRLTMDGLEMMPAERALVSWAVWGSSLRNRPPETRFSEAKAGSKNC